jgi:hypothetical protein
MPSAPNLWALSASVGVLQLARIFKSPILIGPTHQAAEVASKVSFLRRDRAFIDAAGVAIDGDDIIFGISLAIDDHGLLLFRDDGASAASGAAFAHRTGNDGGVGGHTTASGDDGFGIDHADDVFRRGFSTAENDFAFPYRAWLSLLQR